MIFLSNIPFFFPRFVSKVLLYRSSFSGKFILRAVALIVANRSISSSFFLFFSFEINLSSASLISFRVFFFIHRFFWNWRKRGRKWKRKVEQGRVKGGGGEEKLFWFVSRFKVLLLPLVDRESSHFGVKFCSSFRQDFSICGYPR